MEKVLFDEMNGFDSRAASVIYWVDDYLTFLEPTGTGIFGFYVTRRVT